MRKIKKILILILFFSVVSSNLISLENKIIVKINNDIIPYELKNKILTTLILANEDIIKKI